MKDANFYKKKMSDKNTLIDKYINDNIYSQLENDVYPASIYINKLNQDDINIKEFRDRLKELKFKPSNGKEGNDDVILIHFN